jgi:hypothetical protein
MTIIKTVLMVLIYFSLFIFMRYCIGFELALFYSISCVIGLQYFYGRK